MNDPRKCPICRNSNFRAGTYELREAVGELRFRASLPLTECLDCGETMVEGEDLYDCDLRIAVECAKRNAMSRESFRFIRGALGLQSKQTALILGVVPETVSRWEHGAKPVDATAWRFLCTLLMDHAEGRRPISEVLADAMSRPEPRVSGEIVIVAKPRGSAAA